MHQQQVVPLWLEFIRASRLGEAATKEGNSRIHRRDTEYAEVVFGAAAVNLSKARRAGDRKLCEAVRIFKCGSTNGFACRSFGSRSGIDLMFMFSSKCPFETVDDALDAGFENVRSHSHRSPSVLAV